jgi:glycosyltransferase involved in cell wall biosynthesis
MCCSLVAHGHQVTLLVADGKGDEIHSGVSIRDVGQSKSRVSKLFFAPTRILSLARHLDADIFHFHDPALLPAASKLKGMGRIVVFDSHEDIPQQLLSKPYLNKPALAVLAKVYGLYQYLICRKLDGVVCATPTIQKKFLAINDNSIAINNYPLLNELDSQIAWEGKQKQVCYIGGISEMRGIRVLLEAMSMVKSAVKLNLCGMFSDPILERKCKDMPGWKVVNEYGQISRSGVRDVLGTSLAGLVTLFPTPNHINSQPIKMFEYMSAGIPVIASKFPLWREIVEANHCGICVDPYSPTEIASAIDYLSMHPSVACQMGENGRRAVVEMYNWGTEEKKLVAYYAGILS